MTAKKKTAAKKTAAAPASSSSSSSDAPQVVGEYTGQGHAKPETQADGVGDE